MEGVYGIKLSIKNAVQQFIDKLEILRRHGIDVSKIKHGDTIEKLAIREGVQDLTGLEADGLDLKDNIASAKEHLLNNYRGKGKGTPPTEEQARIIVEVYGIALETKSVKTEDIAKSTYTESASKCGEAKDVVQGLLQEKNEEKNQFNVDVP